jgi:hypothetical protein
MIDSLGKMPIQQPIKRWGWEGDHLYKYCPKRGYRMRNMHNIEEANIVYDVGMTIPGFMHPWIIDNKTTNPT